MRGLAIIRRLVGLLESATANTHTYKPGGIWRLAGGAVMQLLAFQKKLAPGSTVNNELILCARAQHTTSVLEQAVSFKAHTEVIHSPLVKNQTGKST